jgi:hypothetical protein
MGKTSLHVRRVQVESMIEHRYLARHLIAFIIYGLPSSLRSDREQCDRH